MTAQNADGRRPAGGDVLETCTESIAQPVDLDEAVAELVSGQDAGSWPVFSSGYGAGYVAGCRDGYREGIAVLDEASALLATMKPADAVEAAAARRRRTKYARPPQTPEQIAARTRSSWRRAEREVAEGQRAG